MKQKVPDSFEKRWGPNRAHYIGLVFRTGVALPAGGDMVMRPGLSWGGGLGMYYKRKLTGLLAVGLSLEIGQQDLAFYLSEGRRFSDTLFGETLNPNVLNESFGRMSSVLGGYVRVNFDPQRGDTKGKYLDLGMWGDAQIARRYSRHSEGTGSTNVRVHISGIPHINPFQYGANARLMMGVIGFSAHYRLSSYYTARFQQLPEPGRLTAGLMVMF